MTINERIRLILSREKVQDKDAADWLGLSKSRLSQKFKDGIWDSVAELRKISEKTGYSLDWLITGEGEEMVNGSSKGTKAVTQPKENDNRLSGSDIRPITVTVDRSGNELISYVPVKAQAGYMAGFADPEYVKDLQAFNLPVINGKGTMRMFQVDGDSMLQLGGGGLHDGDIVVGHYVDDITLIKDNRVYVIVSTEGVVVKRVINRLMSNDKVMILKSDNKNGQYPDRLLHPHEILEVWELKAFISRQLSFSTDLWDVINDLQTKLAVVTDRMDKMDPSKKLKN